VNLRAIDVLSTAFGLPTGYSDHTDGITIAIAAAARGAVVIEKHLTLDRSLPGPDHRASLDPGQFRNMVRAIREVEAALGHSVKTPALSELKNRNVARKSLVAVKPIAAGHRFTPDNLGVKRPGNGISPFHFWELLEMNATRAFEKDELIERCDLLS
jgi:N-acetylneuraminate synthase